MPEGWVRRTDRVRHLHEKLAQPLAQTFVLERRAGEFLVYPGGGIPAGTIHRAPDRYVSVLDNASRPGRSPQAHSCTPQMWVIARLRHRLPLCTAGSRSSWGRSLGAPL